MIQEAEKVLARYKGLKDALSNPYQSLAGELYLENKCCSAEPVIVIRCVNKYYAVCGCGDPASETHVHSTVSDAVREYEGDALED